MIIANMISVRNFAKTNHANIASGLVRQEASPNVINLASDWAPLKWVLILIKPACGLIHVVHPFDFFCFQQHLFELLEDYVTGIFPNGSGGLHLNVAWSAGLDNVYFGHHHYYGHFLSIMKIYNTEETYCYARPTSVIINSNTGLKCWPCRDTTTSDQFQVFLPEYIDTTIFARILDVYQLKKCWIQIHKDTS